MYISCSELVQAHLVVVLSNTLHVTQCRLTLTDRPNVLLLINYLNSYFLFVLLIIMTVDFPVGRQDGSVPTVDPCTNYRLMELVDKGLRHPNVNVSLDRTNICDYYFDEGLLIASHECVNFSQQLTTCLSQSNNSMRNISVLLCMTDVWYSFTSAVSYRMPEYCVPPLHCGTNSPVWMNGTHPTCNLFLCAFFVCLLELYLV